MAKNELKTDGRGSFMASQWDSIRKNGGIAPSPQQLEQIFKKEGDDTVTLTREETQKIITDYFESCISVTRDEETGEEGFIWRVNPTKTALALNLGVSTDTLVDYCRGHDSKGTYYKMQGFSPAQRIATKDFDLVRKAYALIEAFYEQQLALNKNNSGSIFWLLNSQNTRWSNTQDVNIGTIDTTQHLTASQLPRLGNNMAELPNLSNVESEVE